MDFAKTEADYEKYIEKITIDQKNDFFEGYKTILNDANSALKIAHSFAKSKEVQERGFWKDPEFGQTLQDREGWLRFGLIFRNVEHYGLEAGVLGADHGEPGRPTLRGIRLEENPDHSRGQKGCFC